jgi:fructuronate reductase
LPLDDPLADRLRAAVAGAGDPAAVVEAFLSVPEVFGTDLREDTTLRRLLTEALGTLTRAGTRAAVLELPDPVHA